MQKEFYSMVFFFCNIVIDERFKNEKKPVFACSSWVNADPGSDIQWKMIAQIGGSPTGYMY